LGTLALSPERQSFRKSKTRNGHVDSLASNPLLTVRTWNFGQNRVKKLLTSSHCCDGRAI